MRTKEKIILLSQSSLWRLALAALYRLAFFALLAVFRLSGRSQKIIVRRSPWKDLYPGDSDFDLSIVLRESCSAWSDCCSMQRLGRMLKRFFPMLGELWIIPAKRFSLHAQTLWFDYPFPHRSTPEVSWRLAQLLLLQLWPSLFRPRSLAEGYFFRSARKLEWKWYHLFRVFQGKPYSSLRYPSFSSYELWIASPKNIASSIAKIFQRLSRDSSTINLPTDFSFTLTGKSSLGLQQQVFESISDDCLPILEKVRSVFSNVWLCRSRFSMADYLLVFELSDDERFFSHPHMMGLMSELSRLLSRHREILHPAGCVFLTPPLLSFLRSADPVFGALFQKERFDVLTRRFHFQESIRQDCRLSALACELSNHEVLISSLARFSSTEYAEEVFFLQLPILSDIIRHGTVQMNDYWSALQLLPVTGQQERPFRAHSWSAAYNTALRTLDELRVELELLHLRQQGNFTRPQRTLVSNEKRASS